MLCWRRVYTEEAIPHLRRVNAQEALGIAQIDTGQYEEAVANLNAALVKRPGDPDVLYYLGRASGLLPNARSTLSSAHTPTPRAPTRRWERITLCCGKCRKQRRNSAKRCVSVRKFLGCIWKLGLVYAGAARWDKAEEEFRTETKIAAGQRRGRLRLGAALLQEGKAHEARQELARADQLKPDMPETLYSLGKAPRSTPTSLLRKNLGRA